LVTFVGLEAPECVADAPKYQQTTENAIQNLQVGSSRFKRVPIFNISGPARTSFFPLAFALEGRLIYVVYDTSYATYLEDTFMHIDYYKIACDLFALLVAVWLLGLLTVKPAARSQSTGSRLLEIGLTLLASSLVFTHYFQSGWRARLFVPNSEFTGIGGLLLVLLGIAFAIWARVELGGNWSGAVTVKQGHTLIRRGPYTFVRHPIYTGLLLAFLGVAIILGQIRGLLGVGVLSLAFWLKLRMEERFMLEQFGADYRRYQERVKALIPYVL
jgi:protein-S-isoprenylcysteine O-methyltransferase Ste14